MNSAAAASNLVVLEDEPFNAETALAALTPGLTPVSDFYVRSNFEVPEIDVDRWHLSVGGLVSSPFSLSLDDLMQEQNAQVMLTVECAGNGRTLMSSVPPGTPWGLGAVGTGLFVGVPLYRLLIRAGVPSDAVEVLFRGLDAGVVEDGGMVAFERSLPIADAMREDVLVAYEMNGAPLTPAHGYPVRLVVPGYYGVAWVKWLHSIEVLRAPFTGHFQTERYVYRDDPSMPAEEPVRRMRVRSLIASVADGAVLPCAPLVVSGIAWSGEGAVVRVELSDDDGISWTDARLGDGGATGLAVGWAFGWTPRMRGATSLIVRATDAAGFAQPMESVSNALGYGNNVVQRVRVAIT